MMHTSRLELLSFFLQDRLFAIPIGNVRKVIRAVAVTPVPNSGDAFYGVFDFHGEVLPIVNLRHRFTMPPKPISASDRFMIIQTEKRSFALVADEIEEIRAITEADIQELELTPLKKEETKDTGLRQCTFYRSDNAIIVLYDIEKLLNSELILQIDKMKESMEKEEST